MIGIGYVGLVSGAMFSDRGNQVICVDKNPEIVDALKGGRVHIYEPGLEPIVQRSVELGNLHFTTDTARAVKNASAIFLAVGTPSMGDGKFDLGYIRSAAREVGRALRGAEGFRVVVGKSTVPQGTHKILREEIEVGLDGNSVDWSYVANPETLAEGTAVRDFAAPDRIIVGTDSREAFGVMEDLYHPFIRRKDVVMRGTPGEAEMGKLGANTMLALRVAGIDELARIADVTPGVDMEVVRKMIGSDERLGYQFLFPGPGYGGSCFPKDVKGLVHQARQDGYNPILLGKLHESNEAHKDYMGERIARVLSGVSAPVVGVWGVTFKPGTDDMRDSAAVPIITKLINEGADVRIYDPQDAKAREIFGDRVTFCDSQYEAAQNADVLIMHTDWTQFHEPNYSHLRKVMNGKDLFDLRNRWRPQTANREGFSYFGVGRNFPLDSSVE